MKAIDFRVKLANEICCDVRNKLVIARELLTTCKYCLRFSVTFNANKLQSYSRQYAIAFGYSRLDENQYLKYLRILISNLFLLNSVSKQAVNSNSNFKIGRSCHGL